MYDLARTAQKRASRAARSQLPGSGLRVRITGFEIKFLFSTYLEFRLPFPEYGFQHLIIGMWNSGFGFLDGNSNFHVLHLLAHGSRPVAPLTTPSPGMVGLPALSVSVSRLTAAVDAHPSTTGLARAARNRAREIAIARPPLGRLQTGGARAERPRPLPNYAQMTIRLERPENELLRPLRACFPAVILTIARTGKSGMIPATPGVTVCVHYQTKPKMTQVARTAQKQTSFQELSESVSQQWASGSNHRISISVSVLYIWISEFRFKNMAGRI